MEITCVTIDCEDPRRLAEFWCAALGWARVHVAPDNSGAICRPDDPGRGLGGAYLEFVVVPESKITKNRLHLGCNAGSLVELDAEISRLTQLGATVAWEEEFPPAVAAQYRNVVLRDPEGNEFCLGGGAFPG